MNLLRANDNWLRHQVLSQLRKKHKDLFEPIHKSYGKRFLDYISNPKKWFTVFIFVFAVFFIIPFINIDFLNFINIKPETINAIVDQRAANVATIISITLVVVGFLINNLAVKSTITYRLLLRYSLLYAIIYITLSTIGCFILTSTLRDTFDSIQPFLFGRIVLAGTYLVFAVLFLIGFLFNRVFQFSDDKELDKMLHEELMIEAKRNTKQILVKKYSSEQYLALMAQNGIKEFDWAEQLDGTGIREISQEEMIEIQAREKIIYDINVNRISKFISQRKAKGKIYFKKLGLGIITSESNNFIWVKDKINSGWDKWKLKRSLILKIKTKKEKDEYAIRKYFDQKIEELSEEGKYRNLESLLQSYIILYEFQMQHQS